MMDDQSFVKDSANEADNLLNSEDRVIETQSQSLLNCFRVDNNDDLIVQERRQLRAAKLEDIIKRRLSATKKADSFDTRWGMCRMNNSLVNWHIKALNNFYSRKYARILGTIIAVMFIALGLYMLITSLRIVNISIPYSTEDDFVEFELYETVYAPIFIHKFVSGIGPARAFFNMQPPYFGSEFSCKDITKAQSFCTLRPHLKLQKLNNRTFCDLEGSATMNPCGLYTLLINLDDVELDLMNTISPDDMLDKRKRFEAPYHIFQELDDNENDIKDFVEESGTSNTTSTQPPSFLSKVLFDYSKLLGDDQIKFQLPMTETQKPREAVQDNNETFTSIEIIKDAKKLLGSYQYKNVYQKEKEITSKYAEKHPEQVTWLEPGDLTWFYWRRPAPTNNVSILLGRIQTSLIPGKYKLRFTYNEYPSGDSIDKRIELISNIQIFGSRQFLASIFCFAVAIFYLMLWFL